MLGRRALATAVATAVLSTVVGGFVRPAQAAPVYAADTQRSGAGWAFGANDKGQTAPSSLATQTLGATQLPAGGGGLLSDAVSIAGGKGFSLWADHTGTVWGVGDNAYGETGNGTTGGVIRTPVKALSFGGSGQPKVVKVSAFGLAAVVLDNNGAVWQWGHVVSAKGTYTIQSSPTKMSFPSGVGRVVDISAGETFSLALDDKGQAFAWGKNDRGQLGNGTTNTSPAPTKVTGLPLLAAGSQADLEAGRDFGVYTVSSAAGVSIYTWGRGDRYQLGAGSSTVDSRSPRLLTTTVPTPARVLALSGGGAHTLLLTTDGAVRSWGDNGLTLTQTPTVVSDPAGLLTGSHRPYTVAAGDGASFVASTDGSIAAWGVDTTGQLGRAGTGTLTQPTAISIPGTVPAGEVPVRLTSRQGSTYAIVDSEVLRGPLSNGYDFGAVSTQAASFPSQGLTVTNVATKALSFSSVAVEGIHPGDFTVTVNTCTGTLAVDATCTVTARFAPLAAGARQAEVILHMTSTSGGVPLQTVIPVTGRGFTPVTGLANLTLDLAPGQRTTVSGPGNVIPLQSLTPSLIPASVPATASAPLGKLPLGKLPLGKLPLGKLPLGKLPLGKLPLGKLPLGKLPLGKLPLGKLPLGKLPLGKLPLLRQGGWPEALLPYPNLRNVPPSALTLLDLVDPAKNQPDPTITTALPLERIALSDLAVSTSALSSVSLVSVLAGNLRLGQFSGIDWCADLPQIANGGACTDGAGLQRYLLELDLQGVSLDETRVAGVTVGQLVKDSLSPAGSVLDETVFADLLLVGTTLPGTNVGNILLTAIPNLGNVLDCATTDCVNLGARTLGDAASGLKPDATFRDLGTALSPITLGQLVEPFLDRSSFDWESLPLSSIPFAAYPNRVVLQADVDLNCLQVKGTSLGVKLPSGFQYVPGTTTLTRTRGSGTVALADPVVDQARGLVVAVPDSTFGSTGPIACADDSAHLQVRLGVLPTPAAGVFKATADARATNIPTLSTTQATALTVTGVNEPPSDTPDGPLAAADQLIIGSITEAGKPKYVPFEAPAGTFAEVTVGSLESDLDAVLYHPKGALLDPALSAATPAVESPFGEAASVEADELHPLLTTYGGALQDVALLKDRPVAAVAATRGTDLEQLSAKTRTGEDTRYLIAVTGYNRSVGQFTVRIRLVNAPALADCTFVPPPNGPSATTPFYNSTGFAPGDNTVVLVNTARLAARFPGQSAAVLDAAYAYTHSGKGGVAGQVLQVDADPGVQAAEAARGASPCDPLKADGVVRAINTLVASSAPQSLRYVVLAGGDDMIPHARLEDHTRDGNEREQAGDLAINGGNPIASAFAAGYYLSDDPYGTRLPESVLGQIVYQAQVVPSRLGETPSDLIAQFQAFAATDGVADPRGAQTGARTAVVTDYDFLTSGGDQVAAALTAAGQTVDHTLTGINARWTKDDLDQVWLKKATVPSVGVLNAHYDQYRALPALGSATGDLSQLYTSTQVKNGPSLAKRVVFTVGCHGALGVPDGYADLGDPQALDFAQAYAGKDLAAMVGNLGFGYADTTSVAYSSRLQSLFAQALAKGYDLGTALTEAKRAYLDTLAGLSAYDIKSGQQMILWGLPQTRLTSGPATRPTAPSVVAGTLDPRSGLTVQPLQVGTAQNPLQFGTVTTGGSTHLTASATDPAVADKAPQTVAVSGRPVLPAQFVDVPQVAGKQLRSVVPTALFSTPEAPVSATFARAMVDHGIDAEPLGNGVFPAVPSHVGTALSADGNRSTLVVTPASFRADGSAPGAGTIRTYPYGEYTAFYGPAGGTTAPTITRVNGSYTSVGITSYTVDVLAGAGRSISRVYALAQPAAGSGSWVRTELLPDSTSPGRFAGGASGQLGEFLVVALDDRGDAALSTQKGEGWEPQALPAPIQGDVQIAFTPEAPASGWFTEPPALQLVNAPAGTLISIDGGPGVPSGSRVDGDGVHTARVVKADGSLVPGARTVLVDSQVPQLDVSVATPQVGTRPQLNEPVPFTATVVYGASGQQALTDNGLPGPTGRRLATGNVGGKTLTVTATSVAGLSSTTSRPYAVIYGVQSRGFLDPVVSVTIPGSGMNLVSGGSVYGFSYSLVDFAGQPVTTGATTGNAKAFAAVTCTSGNKVQLPKTTGETAQPVHDGNGAYTWDITAPADLTTTSAACSRLTVTLNDAFTQFKADLTGKP